MITKFRHFVVYIFSIIGLYAQELPSDSIKLGDITINSSRIQSLSTELPITITTVLTSKNNIGLLNASLKEHINSQAGIFNQNASNYAQDLRISIRGFGARSAFGIRGIKVIVDDIPESTPDGQGQLDNLNLNSIEKIEILKGPSSGLYGNASGGLINIISNYKVSKNYAESKSTIGSFGFFNQNIEVGFRSGNSSIILANSYSKVNGYRAHASSKTNILSLRYMYHPTQNLKVKFNINYTDSPTAKDPGGVTIDDVNDDRRQARQRNIDFDAGENIKHLKASTTLSYVKSNKKIESKVYYHNRQFNGLLPFENGGAIDLLRNFVGHSSQLTLHNEYLKNQNKLLLGYDIQYQSDDRIRFNNDLGTIGEETLNQTEAFTNYALFIVDNYRIENLFNLNVDLRYDINNLSATDQFISDGDDTGSINYNSFNYGLGIGLPKYDHFYPFIRISSSFETPTLSELSSNPESGGFNLELQPIRSVNYELGIKHYIDNLSVESSIFYIDTENEILPFELSDFPGRDFFRNAGKTNRTGIEFQLVYQKQEKYYINTSYTYSNFRFKDYVNNGVDLESNKLPGIPMHNANVEFAYYINEDLRIHLVNQYVGKLFADDTNEVKINPYFQSDLKLFKGITIDKLKLNLFGGINNIFDQEYFDNIRINAFGNRYYEPAAKRNYYIGLSIRMQ